MDDKGRNGGINAIDKILIFPLYRIALAPAGIFSGVVLWAPARPSSAPKKVVEKSMETSKSLYYIYILSKFSRKLTGKNYMIIEIDISPGFLRRSYTN